jgi:hypothetical protein
VKDSESTLSKLTDIVLCDKKLNTILIMMRGKPSEVSLCIRPACQTESKARSTSSETARTHSVEFSAWLTVVYKDRICSCNWWFARKAACVCGINECNCAKELILLVISLSKTFPIVGRREMGLYELAEVGGFDGLRIIIVLESFHWGGKNPER